MADKETFDLSDLEDILNADYTLPEEFEPIAAEEPAAPENPFAPDEFFVPEETVAPEESSVPEETVATEEPFAPAEPAASVKQVKKPAAPKKAKAPAKRSGSGKKHSKKKKREYSEVRTFLIVVSSFLFAVFALITVFAWKLTAANRSFPNVCAVDFPLGDKSEAEIMGILKTAGWDEENSKGLTVNIPTGISFNLDYLECGASLNSQEVTAMALSYGKDGNIYSNLITYLKCLTKKTDVTADKYSFNEAVIKQAVTAAASEFAEAMQQTPEEVDTDNEVIRYKKISPDVKISEDDLYNRIIKAFKAKQHVLDYMPPTNRLMMPDFQALHDSVFAEKADAVFTEKFEITPEVLGVDFDVAGAEEIWTGAGLGDTAEIPLAITKPGVLAAELEPQLFRDLLGSYSTSFDGSTEERIGNLRLIAEKLDGYIIYPGDEFSYNDVVGERTAEAGFKEAAAYDGEEVVQQIGGGVCQGSSTLHAAALLAQMTITVRSAHNFNPGYLPPSLDATVSWPTPHFKFKNEKWDHPVKIHSYINEEAKTINMELWGTNTDGSHIEIKTYQWPFFHEKYPEVQTMLGGRYELWMYDKDGALVDVFGDDESEKAKTMSFYHLHYEDIDFKGYSIPEEELYNFYGQ